MVRVAGKERDWDSVDACVEAFEEAQADGRGADPSDFLPPPDHACYLDALGELLRVDLEYRWRRGEALPLEDYRDRFPALFGDPARLSGVAFEEFRLRRQAGEPISPGEYRLRYGVDVDDWPVQPPGPAIGDEGPEIAQFPPWSRSQVAPPTAAALVEELRDAEPGASRRLARALTSLPSTGSQFLGFRLEAELGSGAFGRVFLARQGDLAGRPVALKISADVAGESHALARLQHTNVMPIYSVHRAGALQAVCMPYFGATTLADVAGAVGRRPSLPDSGADVVSAIEGRRSDLAGDAPRPDGTRRDPVPVGGAEAERLDHLRGLSYVQAILALAVRIADGLAHAHERGVVHRDLKPANILIADDGEPMLLDFNLATDTRPQIRASAALVGGTLPYMAPEQLAAFAGRPATVDARADVYALGLILFELLTGRHPFEIRRGPLSEVLPAMAEDRGVPPPRPAPARNRAVSPALAAIVRRCLEPDPARRYDDARPLHTRTLRRPARRPPPEAHARAVARRTPGQVGPSASPADVVDEHRRPLGRADLRPGRGPGRPPESDRGDRGVRVAAPVGRGSGQRRGPARRPRCPALAGRRGGGAGRSHPREIPRPDRARMGLGADGGPPGRSGPLAAPRGPGGGALSERPRLPLAGAAWETPGRSPSGASWPTGRIRLPGRSGPYRPTSPGVPATRRGRSRWRSVPGRPPSRPTAIA